MEGGWHWPTSISSSTRSGVLDARPQDRLADSSAMSCSRVALVRYVDPTVGSMYVPCREGQEPIG